MILSWLVGSILDRAVRDIVSCSWVRHLRQKRCVSVSLVRRLDLERPTTLNSAGSVALWDGGATADSYGGTVMIDITALVIGSTLMAWPVMHEANKDFITWSNSVYDPRTLRNSTEIVEEKNTNMSKWSVISLSNKRNKRAALITNRL